MRSIPAFLASAVLLLLPLLSVRAQSWPPGGTTRSPMAMWLPGGRYVPSTKRWNLVWYDQIVPQWVTPGKVEFAASHYVGTQKIFADQATQFRAFNDNFLILTYHLAVGLNPERNDDCPDPKSNSGSDFIGVVAPEGYVAEIPTHFRPWLVEQGIAEGSERYEAMFQHYDEAVDPQRRVWHQDPYWLMDIANEDWTNYIGLTTGRWMEGNDNEGCFFDVAVETNVSLYNPKAGNPAPDDFNWWQAPHGPTGAVGTIAGHGEFDDWINPRYRTYFQSIYRMSHRAVVDYLVLPNVDQMVTTVYDPVWLDGDDNGETVDGAMMEGFGTYEGYDMWLTLERGLRHITGRGKILVAQFGADEAAERLRRTAMYMLIKNENSFINIINSGNVEWYPEYEIDLGDQTPLPATLEALRVAGTGSASLWRRDYERGMALCNTSDQPILYDPPGEGWARIVTSGGGDVADDGTRQPQSIEFVSVEGGVVVPPSGGVLLRRDSAPSTGASQPFPAVSYATVAPNPALSSIDVRWYLSVPGPVRISLVDASGMRRSLVAEEDIAAGEHRRRIATEGIPNGWYFCVFEFPAETIIKPMVIQR